MKKQVEAIEASMPSKRIISLMEDEMMYKGECNIGDKKELNLKVKVIGVREKNIDTDSQKKELEYEFEILKNKEYKKDEKEIKENDEI